MKKTRRWKENLVSAMEVPPDLAYGDAIITINGRSQARIENYRSILCYTSEKIVILTHQGKVTFCGKRLEIPYYTAEEMLVKGRIDDIILER